MAEWRPLHDLQDRLRALKQAKRRPVRVTLSLWYLGSVGAVLALFSLALYFTVASNSTRDLDTILQMHAQGVSDSVFSFWRAERAQAGSGPGNWTRSPSETFAGEVTSGGLPGLLNRWAEKTGTLLQTERPIRVLDPGGRALVASGGFSELPVPAYVPSSAAQARLLHETRKAGTDRFRMVTYPVLWGQQVFYIVQVAANLHPVEASLVRLRVWLLVLIFFTLAILGATWSVLAATALGPFGRLIAQTQRFMEEHLHEQVSVPQTDDEVERLSKMFNEMLGRLEHAFRSLRQFSAAAAHELRNTLTVMRGGIQVVMRKPRSVEEYQQLLTEQLDAVNEMAGTVEELLGFAKWDAARDPLQQRQVELSGLVRHICKPLITLAESKQITLHVATNGPVWVHADQRLFERVVVNLVDNALKYTPAHGSITIKVSSDGQEARLTVQDTGSGISPEELPHLFEQFFRRGAQAVGSTGLGLGLCRWIIEAHRGQLEAASVDGAGATFTVRLPRAVPPSSA